VTDRELSVRAGLNVGIEPTLLPFLQAGAGNVITIKPSGDTVIAENTGQAARVALNCAIANLGGYIYNTGSDLVDVDFLFVDALGNEISLTGGFPIPVVTPGPIPIELADAMRFFCLAPGERIIARVTPDQGDPLSIMGQAGLIGWWRADARTLSSGFASEAFDLSGNNRPLTQASAPLQPGWTPNSGPNGTPAFVFDGTGVLAGTAKRLSRSGAMGLNPGDFPALFVVMQMNTAQAQSLCNTFSIDDSVATRLLYLDRRNTVPPGFFGGIGSLVGTVGGFNGPAILDQAPHLQAMLLQALAANISVDGVLGANKTSTGGLISAPDLIDLGGSSILALGTGAAFGGLIMDAWVTRVQPSVAQLAALNTYVRNRYRIPIS
jgi:hypothetical protein